MSLVPHPEADGDPTADRLLATLSQAARRIAEQDAGLGPSPAVWHRLQVRRAGTALGRIRRRRLVLPGGVAFAALALVVGLKLARGPRPVTYAVGVGAAEQDGYIRGVGAAASAIRFSDGTRVDLERGARVSVLARAGNGARLRVENGEAHFEVVHRPRAAWSVEAGPFVVYVSGTSFDVRWSGSDETVQVRLRSGSVRVAGPLLPERVTLRPGQRLTARLASGELRIDEARPSPAPEVTAPMAPPLLPAEVSPREAPALPEAEIAAAEAKAALPAAEPAVETNHLGPLRRSSVRIERPHRRRFRHLASNRETRFTPSGWLAAVAAGGGTDVVAQAEGHGIDQTLAEVDAGALAALADAARYGGRRDLATRVLVAERVRFPGTPAAQVAAFLLGRLSDDAGDTQVALDWYRRYLTDTPRGPYAAEALGRQMLNVDRLSGRAAARPIAADYVRRFPNGTYLLQAHSILANP